LAQLAPAIKEAICNSLFKRSISDLRSENVRPRRYEFNHFKTFP